MKRSTTGPKPRVATMELEIKKLEQAVCNLTIAVTALTVSINFQKINGNHSRRTESSLDVRNNPIDVPKTVCPDTHCGVINSNTTTCDHTLARYQSEYNCG